MKNIFNKIPKSIKTLLLVNLFVYLIVVSLDFFGVNLNFYLGIHNFNSSDFHFYQFITNIFSHDVFFDHILSNMVIMLLFSFGVYRFYGNKGVVLTYLIGGLISSLTFSSFMTDLNNDSIQYLKESNLDIKTLPIDNTGEIDRFGMLDINTTDKQNWAMDLYDSSVRSAVGASGSICAIMMVYLLTFIFNYKKVIYNLLIVFFVFVTTVSYYYGYLNTIGSTVAHLGGFIGGIICFIILKINI